MTDYAIDTIMKDVRVALDRNMSSEALAKIGDMDTLAVDDIIKSKITEAVKRVHSQAEPYLLDGGLSFGESLVWDDANMCCGHIRLPDDFMRFIIFQMSDWERPVFYAIGTDEPAYLKMSSRFRGIRGTAQRPVCVVSINHEGNILEFYSCKSTDAKVSKALYLPYPEIVNDVIGICKRCYDAAVYTIAALTVTTLGESDNSEKFNELAKSTLI